MVDNIERLSVTLCVETAAWKTYWFERMMTMHDYIRQLSHSCVVAASTGRRGNLLQPARTTVSPECIDDTWAFL